MNKCLVLAYLIAPIAPTLLDAILRIARNSELVNQPFEMSNFFSPLLLILSYICASVIGIPAYLLFFCRYLAKAWWKYVLFGAVIGCVPAVLLAVTVNDNGGLGSGITSVATAIGLVYGAIAGFAFWMTAFAERVNRRSATYIG